MPFKRSPVRSSTRGSAPTPGKAVGDWAEQQAKKYLQDRGLEFWQGNYRCKLGEIDLIMHDKDTIVFVEVRSRKQNRYGTAFESVNRGKQQRLIRTAKYYLQKNKLTEQKPCRFDVVSVDNTPALDERTIQWIPNAFSENC